MTAIAPGTNIKILRNVPLDDTYDHTIFFPKDSLGQTAQYNYFAGKAKYSLTNQTYQRVKRGWIRVGIEADNLYDCNYLMFQNENFGTKWFYAFIKSVEYINNETSEIEYEIDVMQTWHFSYTLDKCWVEREHSAEGYTDSLYTSEPVDAGVYMYNTYAVYDMNSCNVAILYTNETNTRGHEMYNTYLDLEANIYNSPSSTRTIAEIINGAIQGGHKIIDVYLYPSAFAPANNENPQAVSVTKTINKPSIVSGYTPKNKKLLYYPYSFLRVSTQEGNYHDYLYEYFSTNDITFKLTGVVIPSVTVNIYPLDYKRVEVCYEEKLSMTNFPRCIWSENSFDTWWAVNKYGTYASIISKSMQMFQKADASISIPGHYVPKYEQRRATKENFQTATNLSESIATAGLEAWATPNNTYGEITNGNVNIAFSEQKVLFYYMGVTPQRARIIDSYFDRFGYATMRNKVPNRNVRPHWCYTKTQGCTITGSIPVDHASAICQIYDHGITFWKNGNEVGNYNLDNTINEG